MLLETIQSLIARVTTRNPTREENVTQPALFPNLSTEISPALVLPTSNLSAAVSDPTPTSGFFAYSHNNVIYNPTMISSTFEDRGGAIMQLLESKTIQGAEYDSSARYPPPKCHPETRQTLREKVFDWIANPNRGWRLFYILGSAGVGKSAVAQSVADRCEEADCLGASCFISRPNHRNDPDGVIPTLAYQLAVKHEVYKQIMLQKLAHNPTILRKTRRVQFKELLIDPFRIVMTQDPSAVQKPLLIIIDGLDECASQGAQCEFIELISDHVRSFPEFPLLWLICSRPESHLKYTLSQVDFQVMCRREEMLVDDEEAQEDVLIYLRSEFENMQRQYHNSLSDDWPPENDLLRIARAASGLFAFASTVTRFIGDADAGDPSNQLQIFITILEGSNMSSVENPYLTLDLLYRHILTSVPSKILPTTMRIIGMCIFYAPETGYYPSARRRANFLKIRKAAFEHALKQLHSVLRISSSSDAFDGPVEFYHASFADFLRNPGRSGELCLDEAAIHYDVAVTALSWLMDSGYDIQKGDFWISPSEDEETCLAVVKNMSKIFLWEACSRVEKENAVKLYQELQNFDFSCFYGDYLALLAFGEFLSWLQIQERASSTPKLLNSLTTYEECHETRFTEIPVTEASVPGFTSAGFATRDSSNEPKKIHLNLGCERCLHIHLVVQTPKSPYISVDVFLRNLLRTMDSEALQTMTWIIGMSILYPLQTGCKSARTQVNFFRIGQDAFDHILGELDTVLNIGTPSDAFHNSLEIDDLFCDFLRDPMRSGECCLDESAVHYDVARTALSWLMESEHEIQKEDIWMSPSEDLQTCLKDIKSLSLSVLWEACSCVDGENPIDLYTRLLQFDFNVLDSDIPIEWRFGEFLSWLNLQERNSSTPKLLSSLAIYEDCHESRFTELVVDEASLAGFTPEGFVTGEPFDPPEKIHFNLGHGMKCRHIHITVKIDVSEESESYISAADDPEESGSDFGEWED